MTRPLVAVLDYGIGNLHSARKALERGGADARLTADTGLIAEADGVVLPGVGAFGACMDALRTAGLERGRLTMPSSPVDRFSASVSACRCCSPRRRRTPRPLGWDIIPGTVRWIPPGPKIPQMQWNLLQITRPDDPMLRGLGDDPWVYFVHSLHGVPDDPDVVAATVEYGTTLNAAFRLDNVFAAQFHPEKSSRPGLALLSNFVEVCATSIRPNSIRPNSIRPNSIRRNGVAP